MPVRTHKVKVTQKNGVCMEVEARGLKIIADEPLQAGGSNLGPTPVELLLGSLGSCQAIATLIFASMKRIRIDEIQVEVEGDMNNDGLTGLNPDAPTGYQDIRFHFFIKSPEPEERIKELLEFSEQKCPVGDTLRKGANLAHLQLTML